MVHPINLYVLSIWNFPAYNKCSINICKTDEGENLHTLYLTLQLELKGQLQGLSGKPRILVTYH